MKKIGFIWGVAGVLAMLMFAIIRLSPIALEIFENPLIWTQWAFLAFFVPYMAYAEGYKGFCKGFSLRVIARALYLKNNPKPLHLLLAPLFCMGFFYATRRRLLSSFALTFMIICFVVVVRIISQPWRGIIDAGVVVGLGIGLVSLGYFAYLALTRPGSIKISADIPGQDDDDLLLEGMGDKSSAQSA